MKRRLQTLRALPALALAAALLAACSPAQPAATPAPTASATPAATPTVEPAAAPTAAPEMTPAPAPSPVATPDPLMEISTWSATMPGQAPRYTIETGEVEFDPPYVTWPEEGVTLCIRGWKGSMEEAAETYGVPLETLQALNPDPRIEQDAEGDPYYSVLILEQNYQLPTDPVKRVTVEIPWIENRYERSGTYAVPASLSDQAAACMATAYHFQYEHFGMHVGIEPSEQLPGNDSYFYYSTEGAMYTSYSDLEQFLHCVYTPDYCARILGGPLDQRTEDAIQPYYQGENDTICFQVGDRGSYIAHCGTVYTEPELQPDGSLTFWQLSLTIESEDFQGWGEDKDYVPDTATISTVRLEPGETGWRVAALTLPN